MRKFAIFVLSFSASVVLFAIVAIAVLLLSGAGRDIIGSLGGGNVPNEQSGNKLSVEAKGAESVAGDGLSVLIIYSEPATDELYLADCFISPVDFSFDACPLRPDKDFESSVKLLLSEGKLYSAIDSIQTFFGLEFQNFIKFDSESFRKIADRMDGVVYNENNTAVLLTGNQAVKKMDSEFLSFACSQFYDTASRRNILDEILYIADKTENDFSFPAVYDMIF
ncbi:MAG: hypothetical protein E7525_02090 [Ruminococcaceae bacterium]|nr:hypothetical protein [Oscillospiraceae bacterium]